MATKYWRGTATAVAQVHTASIDTVDGTPANNTFTVTIGSVAISQVGTTDVATTATNLRASLNASTHPYFSTITWSGTGGSIIGTADTAGVPFVAALTVTGAGTGTVTDFAVTTAMASPNAWGTADNWSDGVVPANTDTVILEANAISICWELDQSSIDLAALHIRKTYTGKIGLDRSQFATDSDADTFSAIAKPEYRQAYLKIGYDTCDIGEHVGPGTASGSGRIKIHNNEANVSTTVVHGTASSSTESGLPAVRLLIDNANALLYIRGASAGVGVAVDVPGETSSASVIAIADGNLYVGQGVTVTTFSQTGGVARLDAAATITTATIDNGVLTTEGDYTITTLNVNGGICRANHIKTGGNAITTANANGGSLDGTQNGEARTWATVNITQGGQITADSAAVTITTLNEPSNVFTLSAV